jgi:hypothetical protein
LILLQLDHELSQIHGLEISLQLLKSTRVNPEFMREKNQRRDTAPQRKISFLPEHRRRQNKHARAAGARILFDQSAPHDRIVSRLHG